MPQEIRREIALALEAAEDGVPVRLDNLLAALESYQPNERIALVDALIQSPEDLWLLTGNLQLRRFFLPHISEQTLFRYLPQLEENKRSALMHGLSRNMLQRVASLRETARIEYQRFRTRYPSRLENLRDGNFMPNYYVILGVPRDASCELMKESFHRLAFLFHPDHDALLPTGSQDDPSELFRMILEAYDVLQDQEKRRDFYRCVSHAAHNYPEKEWFQKDDPIQYA